MNKIKEYFKPRKRLTMNEWQLLGIVMGVEAFVIGADMIVYNLWPIKTHLMMQIISGSTILVIGIALFFIAAIKVKVIKEG